MAGFSTEVLEVERERLQSKGASRHESMLEPQEVPDFAFLFNDHPFLGLVCRKCSAVNNAIFESYSSY